MIPSIAALLLSSFAPGLRGPGGSEGDWIPLDGVAAVINDEIVKESELQRELSSARERLEQPISTAEELDEFQGYVRSTVVKRRLRTQAGAELGLAQEEVDRMIDEHLVDKRKRRGLLSYIGDLSSRGIDEHEIHSETRRQFYQGTWESSVLGEEAAGRRPQHDRFVRPGEMYFRYKESIDAFADPPEVRLRQYIVVQGDGETAAEARARCLDVRERVKRGEPLERLLLDAGFDSVQTSAWTGTTEKLPQEELALFALRGTVGSPSEVVERPLDDGGKGFLFIVLEDRRNFGPPRPFVDGAVQAQLKRRVLVVRDRERLSTGESSLIESAYIAPPLPAQEAPRSP